MHISVYIIHLRTSDWNQILIAEVGILRNSTCLTYGEVQQKYELILISV